jgi:hypothetical protein
MGETMIKYLLVAVAAMALCGVSHADSYTVPYIAGEAVITTVQSDITSAAFTEPFTVLGNAGTITTDLTNAELLFDLGETYQALGNLTLADTDFNTSIGDLDSILTILGDKGVSYSATYAAAPEPGALVLLAMGLASLVALRFRKQPKLVAVEAAA